jgi:hypothetical protein
VAESIAVAGSIAQRPGRGGHAWVFLQYLLGFQRLGYEVLFVDRLTSEMLPPGSSAEAGVRWVEETMATFGLSDSYAVLLDDDESAGRSRKQVLEHLRSSILLIDVMGFLEDEELSAAAPRRLFLDIDPGFPQMWQELDLHTSFGRHDAYATVGLRVGKESCRVPTCGVEWINTPQPVVLDHWPVAAGGSAYTSVASWRGPFGPIEYEGERFGLRAHQMRDYAELPTRTGLPMEVALEIEAADSGDAELLRAGGWKIVEPLQVASNAESYRVYVQNSRAEVGVAKDMYVRSRGGWLSDRSLCYLASGKPVLAQATGFELEVETGAGLLSFATPEEAAAAVEEIESGYACHSEAARELAQARFDSDRVLTDLLAAAA